VNREKCVDDDNDEVPKALVAIWAYIKKKKYTIAILVDIFIGI